MNITINREAVLSPLSFVVGVIERRQTQAVLANVLCEVDQDGLHFTGTDQEVELSASTKKVVTNVTGEITIPAKKFFDICRSLPAKAELTLVASDGRLNIKSGRFTSYLSTLPATEFPKVEINNTIVEFDVGAEALSTLLEKTAFAMAQQDVRYFFNGMLLEIEGSEVRAIATNGQRLAMSAVNVTSYVEIKRQFIVPRKGISELFRVLKDAVDGLAQLTFTDNHLHVLCGKRRLTTKLIDASYPDYEKAIPRNGTKKVILSRLELKDALNRIAILSNEMYRNVKLYLSSGILLLNANNPMQEEAEESVNVEYDGEELEIGFNVSYLIDVLTTLKGDKVTLVLADANSAMLVTCLEEKQSVFVVSPMMM